MSAATEPPDAAPAASAPAGPRATALTTAINEALSHTLKACSYTHFASCFPTIAANRATNLRAVWQQMVERLEMLAKNEFASILSEREVVPSLNELDRLIADARRRKAVAPEGEEAPVPPHTLPPEVHLRAHLLPFLQQQQSLLNARLQTTQSRNADLAREMERQREEMRALVGVLEGVVRDVEEAGEAVGAEAAGVRKEVGEMEAEL